MNNTAKEVEDKRDADLAMIMRMSQGHDMQSMFTSGLILEKAGEVCLAQAAAFIRGIWVSDKEQAREIAHDLVQQLHYLEEYGGTVGDDEHIDGRVPNYRVGMSHDLTFLGFSLCWYRATKVAEEEDANLNEHTLFSYMSAGGAPCISKWVPWIKEYNTWNYKFSHNGAMLYRGPAAGEVHSVHIGTPRFWSIHT